MYKRQVVSAAMRFGGINLINEEWLSNPLSEVLSMAAYILLIIWLVKASRPVSYTHLDVYKRQELYEDEVFVFTPKGDLYKMPKGATVLDFALSLIHIRCV